MSRVTGGKTAARTNYTKYGPDYYKVIGAKGGKAKVPKGFSVMDPHKHSVVSAIGGRISRRPKGVR